MDPSEAANTFTRMLYAIDARDWAGVRRAFADAVVVDYSTLFGAPAATVDADAHVAGWRGFGEAFDMTQHMTGPIVVTPRPDAATAHTHVRAYHRINGAPGGDTWMVAGHYQIGLVHGAEGWKIGAITLTVFCQEGNLTLPDRARARIAT
jgi:hypothetical protein